MALKSNLPSLTPAREKFKRDVKLLSGGFSAPDAFPDGMITVYPWDSNVDDWLMERSKGGRKDQILFDLLPKICNLNGCDIKKFVVGDINTVLLVARSIPKDNKLILNLKCPKCNHSFTETLPLPDGLEKVGEKPAGYNGVDVITLPDCKDIVEVRPLLVEDEMAIMSRSDKKNITDRQAHLISAIKSINATTGDVAELYAWLMAIHPKDLAFLESQIDLFTPHLGMTVNIQCPACGHEFVHTLQLDAEFFRSGVSSGY